MYHAHQEVIIEKCICARPKLARAAYKPEISSYVGGCKANESLTSKYALPKLAIVMSPQRKWPPKVALRHLKYAALSFIKVLISSSIITILEVLRSCEEGRIILAIPSWRRVMRF